MSDEIFRMLEPLQYRAGGNEFLPLGQAALLGISCQKFQAGEGQHVIQGFADFGTDVVEGHPCRMEMLHEEAGKCACAAADLQYAGRAFPHQWPEHKAHPPGYHLLGPGIFGIAAYRAGEAAAYQSLVHSSSSYSSRLNRPAS